MPIDSDSFNSPSQPQAPALSRLGLYDPTSQTFGPVTHGSIGGVKKQNVYVVTHGWAFGYAQIVEDYAAANNGALLKVWQTVSYPPGGTPAGAWIFEPTFGPVENPILVSPVGMAQAIAELDTKAAVLVFSWLDGSATPADLSDGNYSQMNTDLYGFIASQAIQQALVPGFPTNGNGLHLLGHSDGSKVMTVAAGELIRQGIPVAQLTLFDSPEDSQARQRNSANFIWYYLQNVPGTRPATGPTGTFIDNYISMFGTQLAVFSYTAPDGTAVDLSQIVDTHLASNVLYGNLGTEDGKRHVYAPAWYSGTSLDEVSGGDQYGLGWSPLLHPPTVAGGLPEEEEQTWTQAVPADQFILGPASASPQTPSFSVLYPGQLDLICPYGIPHVSGQIPINLPGIAVDGFSFDYAFIGDPQAGFHFSVELNDTLLFMMYANRCGTTPRSATLNTAALQGGFGKLVFTLTNQGFTFTSMAISNIYYFTGLTS
jgi:hypothetical protein